ncbi:MAG: hypothetical protein HYX59_13965 [Elusimicrobia bacterium]|nr:hypothetical protein [Elusimicrobiota bacterium]
MKRLFWIGAFTVSISALGIYGNDFFRDPYSRPIDPGILAQEDIHHLVIEGGKPDAKEFSVPREQLLAVTEFTERKVVHSARLAMGGTALALIAVIMSIVGFLQSGSAPNHRIERPAAR